MTDLYESQADSRDHLGKCGRNVTPSGSDVDLDPVPKAIFVATDRVLSYVPADNADGAVVTMTVTAGFAAYHRPRRIKAATTCVVWTVE
ncbi:spike base protein, RCAP_Rcc01079 family [Ancylobacter sp. SL191]|uniref:spike base protein, RCAP_Rcc01079 family n=1 Tax=Ancylobacter sp. SL191 TaxID=2995166 RepID=UPI002270A444|nr:hypothetical protein [Ancylobacter sp. SL191]WAC25743.1 hypothetical protein OU996_11935 [Ancylobacter sp. SL191]